MEYQTKLVNKEDVGADLGNENEEPGDLADRLYQEWRDDKLMGEAAEA